MSKDDASQDMGPPPPATSLDVPRAARNNTVQSNELLAGREALYIEHRGSVYCLRQTSNGKLILTK